MLLTEHVLVLADLSDSVCAVQHAAVQAAGQPAQPARPVQGFRHRCSHRKAVSSRQQARSSVTDTEAPPAEPQLLQHPQNGRHHHDDLPESAQLHLQQLEELDGPAHSVQHHAEAHTAPASPPAQPQSVDAEPSSSEQLSLEAQPASPWLAEQPPSAMDSLEEADQEDPWVPDWDKFEYLASGSLSSVEFVDHLGVRMTLMRQAAWDAADPCRLHAGLCSSNNTHTVAGPVHTHMTEHSSCCGQIPQELTQQLQQGPQDGRGVPREREYMGSESMPWDVTFHPHEYLSPSDIELALEPNRMQPLANDAQVRHWR